MKRMEEKWSRYVTYKFLKQKESILVFIFAERLVCVSLFFLNESSFCERAWRIVEAHFLQL